MCIDFRRFERTDAGELLSYILNLAEADCRGKLPLDLDVLESLQK